MWDLLNTKSDFTFCLFMLPIMVSFFSATSIFFLGGRSRSKRNLCALMWFIVVCMTGDYVFDYLLQDPPYRIYQFWGIIFSIIAALFMFVYVFSITQPQKWCLRAIRPWVFVAAVLLLLEIILSATGNAYPDVYSWAEFRKIIWYPEPLLRFLSLWYFVFIVVYFTIWLFRHTYNYRKRLVDSHSYTEKIDLTWVYYICGMLTIFGLLAVVYTVNSELGFKSIFSFVTFIFMFAIHILGMWQQEVPLTESIKEAAKPEPESIIPHAIQLVAKIDAFFEEERPYLNPKLTLQDVAVALDSNRTYISRAINSEKGVSFYQYANTYRIQHALELLRTSEANKFTMDAIATRSGFNSMTTFYYFFRQEKDCTPRQFMKAENEKQKREAEKLTPLIPDIH